MNQFTARELTYIMKQCIDKNPKFNSSFLESLITRVRNGNNLTEKQIHAVENIIDGYKLGEQNE